MNPGERLYERLTDEIGLGLADVIHILDVRRGFARTAEAYERLERLEDQYIARYARDVDPRWV